MGSGVCDHHPNLGLRCLPFHHPSNEAAADHWRGLRYDQKHEISTYKGKETFKDTLANVMHDQVFHYFETSFISGGLSLVFQANRRLIQRKVSNLSRLAS